MLGPQVGINVKETHNLEYYRNLYEHLLEKLSIIMESYNVEAPDFITLIMKELVLEETIKKGEISKIEISKGLGKIGEVKRNFNSSILPFTYNEKYFGNLLQGSLKLEFLNKLIDQLEENKLTSYSTNTIPSNINSLKNVDFTEIEVSDWLDRAGAGSDTTQPGEMDQIAFLRKVISAHYTETTETTEIKLTNLFRVYLSPNRKYLIISSLTKDFIYIRVIFNIKTGKFTYFCRDILQLDNKYTGRLLLNSAALLQI